MEPTDLNQKAAIECRKFLTLVGCSAEVRQQLEALGKSIAERPVTAGEDWASSSIQIGIQRLIDANLDSVGKVDSRRSRAYIRDVIRQIELGQWYNETEPQDQELQAKLQSCLDRRDYTGAYRLVCRVLPVGYRLPFEYDQTILDVSEHTNNPEDTVKHPNRTKSGVHFVIKKPTVPEEPMSAQDRLVKNTLTELAQVVVELTHRVNSVYNILVPPVQIVEETLAERLNRKYDERMDYYDQLDREQRLAEKKLARAAKRAAKKIKLDEPKRKKTK